VALPSGHVFANRQSVSQTLRCPVKVVNVGFLICNHIADKGLGLAVPPRLCHSLLGPPVVCLFGIEHKKFTVQERILVIRSISYRCLSADFELRDLRYKSELP